MNFAVNVCEIQDGKKNDYETIEIEKEVMLFYLCHLFCYFSKYLNLTFNMTKYLIIAETNDTGYFVEFHETLEKAIERSELYFELAFNPPYDFDRLEIEFKPIGMYSIYEQFILLEKSHFGICNGFYSTEVLEVNSNFNMKFFSLLRASAQSVFNSEQLDRFSNLDEKYGNTMVRTVWVN